MNKTSISVVIPCYYAEKSISAVVEQTAAQLEGYDYEIILVNDGSADGTYSELRRLAGSIRLLPGSIFQKTAASIMPFWPE